MSIYFFLLSLSHEKREKVTLLCAKIDWFRKFNGNLTSGLGYIIFLSSRYFNFKAEFHADQ
jgi:hypothetical protein